MEGGKPSEGDSVRLKKTGEERHIVHVFSVNPFKGDVVVLVGSEGSFVRSRGWRRGRVVRWRRRWIKVLDPLKALLGLGILNVVRRLIIDHCSFGFQSFCPVP